MALLQPHDELEEFYDTPDPWGYESNPDDARRLATILSEIPERKYARALDIGCGEGFLTRHLPAGEIVGADISENAIARAKTHPDNGACKFICSDLFGLPEAAGATFDFILITGVVYPQYFASSLTMVYAAVDQLLAPGGVLVTSHIDSWYTARFPYLLSTYQFFPYREHTQRLEVYFK